MVVPWIRNMGRPRSPYPWTLRKTWFFTSEEEKEKREIVPFWCWKTRPTPLVWMSSHWILARSQQVKVAISTLQMNKLSPERLSNRLMIIQLSLRIDVVNGPPFYTAFSRVMWLCYSHHPPCSWRRRLPKSQREGLHIPITEVQELANWRACTVNSPSPLPP